MRNAITPTAAAKFALVKNEPIIKLQQNVMILLSMNKVWDDFKESFTYQNIVVDTEKVRK